MKCLFLDVDGVLNSTKYMIQLNGTFNRGAAMHPDMDPDLARSFHMLDPESCARLRKVLTVTDAKVVLSSSWRHGTPLTEMAMALHLRGCPATFVGSTPHLNLYRGRGQEIDHWLREHPTITQFAIVDDDSDMEPHMDRLVKTSHDDGLMDEHVERLIEMLR